AGRPRCRVTTHVASRAPAKDARSSAEVRSPDEAPSSDVPPLGTLSAAIFLLSFGTLTVEIAFTRVFSYGLSYHFAYLTIATALLGFGSAGSVLTAWPDLWGDART